MKTVFGCVWAVVLLGGVGCGSSVASGVRAYHAGVPTTALEHFLEGEEAFHLSCSCRSFESRGCVRYALYRGLSHLSLGDRESSEHWLARAKMWMDEAPDVLDSQEQGRLIAGWVALGHTPGTWGKSVWERR